MNATTRRSLLGGVAVLAAAPLKSAATLPPMLPGVVAAESIPVTGMPHPDAELLALAEWFIAAEQAVRAVDLLPDENVDMVEMERLVDITHGVALAMGSLHARTADGILARARCLAAHNADGAFSMDGTCTTAGRLAFDLMRDAGALGGAAVSVTSPDAQLMEACAAFDRLERAYLATGFRHEIDSPEEMVAEAERERIYQAQQPLVARMVERRAVTREGQAARARSLALWAAELMKDGTGDTGQRLTYAIVRDLVA